MNTKKKRGTVRAYLTRFVLRPLGWWIVKRLEDVMLWCFDFRKVGNHPYRGWERWQHKNFELPMGRSHAVRLASRMAKGENLFNS